MLEKYYVANAEHINAKFESVEASLERKIVKMEIDLLASNLELISDNIFAKVKDIVARLPEVVVAQLRKDGGEGALGAGPSNRGKEASEDAGKFNPGYFFLMHCQYVLILGMFFRVYGKNPCFVIVYRAHRGKKIVLWMYWDMEITAQIEASFDVIM